MNYLTASRTLPCILALLALNCATTCGQDWVKSMFAENSHDFGNVPRGAKTEFLFKLANKYEEDVHIAAVRSSCGCTIPRIDKQQSTLKTYQEGAIACEFNTRSFIGAKSAVVTVVFDKPFYGEMQLMVKGNIRSDIVTEPGEIQFGDVEANAEQSTEVKITYAGTNQWEINDVRSANQHLGVKLQRIEDGSRKIEYLMKVRLKGDAPAGAFNDQIVLVTNDTNYNLVTIPVRGNIVPPLVMPVSVELGTVRPGDAVQQRMIVKGKVPFEITKIECGDSRFTFDTPEGSKSAHIIPIKFAASKDTIGAFKQTVTVYTSMPGESAVSTTVTGNVAD